MAEDSVDTAVDTAEDTEDSVDMVEVTEEYTAEVTEKFISPSYVLVIALIYKNFPEHLIVRRIAY